MKWDKTRVLVTGGAGFIGSNLVLRLVQEGARVTVLDCFIPASGANPFNLRPVRDKIALREWDLRNSEKLPECVADQDVIFNLAGQVSHQDSIENPLLDMQLNAQAPLNLLEACRRANPNAVVIYTGTRQVYGIPKILPVDEAHPVQPVDFNGVSNFAGEQYHRLYHRICGLKTVCFRLTNTYGPRLLIKHPRQGFLGWFLNRALTGNEIQLYGGGRQVRDLNYVDDVLEALMLAAGTETCFGEVFNLSGERATLREIATRLQALAGQGALGEAAFPEELKRIDIGDYYGSSEKFRKLTGWEPKTSLTSGLQKTYDYYREFKNYYLE